jgi:glycosyltransferase involved in cell wall biosynthesis
MVRADLHVHSRYSDHPTEWFLQRLGASESYTEPEAVYGQALSEGMDFVTITDHNDIRGALELKERYPERVITGVESTVYFPEDGCKAHLLIYGLDAAQFERVQALRTDIYRLRDYLLEEDLLHSLAHATHAVNEKLSPDHLEKFLLLFTIFEGVNGARNRLFNEDWIALLASLDEERMEGLAGKHGIKPVGENPWIKGITGGSDDHAGLLIGRTWTEVDPGAHREIDTPEAYLEAIRSRTSAAGGMHNDFRTMSFGFYKIAVEFGRQRRVAMAEPFSDQVNEFLFNNRKLSLTGTLKLNKLRSRKAGPVMNRVADLIDAVGTLDDAVPIERRIDTIYERITAISDEFIRELAQSAAAHIQSGSLWNLVRSLSASLPGLFLSAPFVSTFLHMFKKRDLLPALRRQWGIDAGSGPRKILWFTDTLEDLNGVSVTLSRIAALAEEQDRPIRIVTSLADASTRAGVLALPPLSEIPLPYYESLTLRVPSFLSALKMGFDEDPQTIYISSPGPMGLLGLALGRLMQVRTVGVYHTDFTREATEIAGDEAVGNLVETYLRWFFSAVDEIQVPTTEYMTLLADRGYDRSRMTLFRRGVDVELFHPEAEPSPALIRALGRGGGARTRGGTGKSKDITRKRDDTQKSSGDGESNITGSGSSPEWQEEGFVLVYAGRVSPDKNLDFLLRTQTLLRTRGHAVQLLIAGEGPSLDSLRRSFRKSPGVRFLGRLAHRDLPGLLAGAHLFVFPSNTDTFGMAVLEAQACGLPCLVSDAGGPKEIIFEGKSGFSVPARDPENWADQIEKIMKLRANDAARYGALRSASRRNAVKNYDWNRVLDSITGVIP